MKRNLIRFLCMLLCLLLAMPCAAQADVLDFFNGLNNPLAPTPTTPSHSWNFLSFNFWLNPKDGNAYAKWDRKGKNLLFAPCVENKSADYTVDAVDFVVYCTNAYGEAIIPDGQYSPLLYFSLATKIKPGKHVYTNYCELTGMRDACEVYIAISRYHLKDCATFDCVDDSQTDYREKYYFYNWDVT